MASSPLLFQLARRVAGRTLFVIVALSACHATSTSEIAVDASAPDAAVLARPNCARPPPPDGERCAEPEGTTCDFSACGTRIARCTAGVWRYGQNKAVAVACPDPAPAAESSCPPCWPASLTCEYTQACADGGAGEAARASCRDGVWQLEFHPCDGGGGDDGGTNVQGDAGTDAD